MRSLILVLFLVLLSGCVERGASEPVIKGESEVEVVCKHPRGHIELYRAKGVKGLYGLTKSRSGLWYFRGERVSDGKLVDVLGNNCFVERGVK
jgi:hypothetical protein